MADIDGVIGRAVSAMAAVDPNPTDPFRGLYVTDDAAQRMAAEVDGRALDERLAAAVAALRLDPLDAAILALCAAPVLDARYGRLVAYLHDDVTRKLPSPRLIARLLGTSDVLARLAHDAPLRACGALVLLDEDETIPLPDRMLALDAQLAGTLTGAPLAAAVPAGVRDAVLAGPPPPAAAEVRRMLDAAAAAGLPALVWGTDAEHVLAHAAGTGLVLLDAARLDQPRAVPRARLRALLTGARLAIGGLEAVAAEHHERVAAALAAEPMLLCARSPARALLAGIPHLAARVGPPGVAERAAAWRRRLPDAEVAAAAETFVMSTAQIEQAAGLAAASAAAAGRGTPAQDDLLDAARRVSRGELERHAVPLDVRYTWDDIVLPPDDLAVLRSIVAHVRHRELVLGTWGFGHRIAPAAGLKILFAGESGTGKTLAAQVIAGALGLDVYRVDLARTVSKYIGETEKNLGALFDAARDANAVLLFDEADALFGKRSTVSDAHDRYANLEVAYLLQRIEEHPGVVILATNLRQNMDRAFVRRLDFAVEFALPDRDLRRLLWERHLPPGAPLAPDLDVDALAQHQLAGGSIRNCALAAAFAAADAGAPIGPVHVEHALRLEHRKLGRLTQPPARTTSPA